VLCTVYYVVIFTCTLARSHPESKRRWVKLEPLSLKAINSILWTSVTTRRMLARMGAGPSSVYTQKGTMKDVLARCLKKTDVQVCTLTSVYILFCNANNCALATYLPSYDQQSFSFLCTSCVCIITGVSIFFAG
jgi:hypothetical protein